MSRTQEERALQSSMNILRACLRDVANMVGAIASAGDAAHADVDEARAELLQAMLDALTPKIVHAIGERPRSGVPYRVFIIAIEDVSRNGLVLLSEEPFGFHFVDAGGGGSTVKVSPVIPPAQVVAAGWRDVVSYLDGLTQALEAYAGASGKRGGAKGRAEKDRALAARFRVAVTQLRGP